MKLAICALALALAACGGDSGSNEKLVYEDDVTNISVGPLNPATPITRAFTEAGTYKLTLTGSFTPSQPSSGALDVWFSFSGQGGVAGDPEPSYALSGSAAVAISESVTVTLTGAGPWQVSILCGSPYAGTFSDLKLHTVEQ